MVKYNKELANRFVSDYKLPIPITFIEEYFFYYLNVLEKDYGAMTKYQELWNHIDKNFDGDYNKFLKNYYDTRDHIIKTMSTKPEYLEFNNMNMNKFAIVNRPPVSSNDIYNENNCNKFFISVDLKKANFQALKYVNKDILFGADTYEDFIGNFTDSYYIKDSKYTRQVIFGQLNPKRHITVEKYIINKVREYISENSDIDTIAKLVSMSTDEILYEVTVPEDNLHKWVYMSELIQNIKKDIGVDVSISTFILEGYYVLIEGKETNYKGRKFFHKHYPEKYNKEEKGELKAIPLQFFMIVYKLFNKIKTCDIDYHFNYEGLDAKIENTCIIEKIHNNLMRM